MTRPGRRSSRGVRKKHCSPSFGLKTEGVGQGSGQRGTCHLTCPLTTVRANADIVLSARTRVHLLRCPLLRDKAQEDAAQHWAAATVSLGPDGLYHSTYPEVLGVCALLHGTLSPVRVITLTRRLKGPHLGQGVRRESTAAEGGSRPLPTTSACYSLLCGARTGRGPQAGGLALS